MNHSWSEAEVYRAKSQCRSCQGDLTPVLTLGDHTLPGWLAPEVPDRPRAPLELVQCERCTLVQLAHTVNPDLLYRDYWYRSSVTSTMRTALSEIVQDASLRVGLREGDTVLDIGCNDGWLLAQYPAGVTKIGFDPSDIAPEHLSPQPNHLYRPDYFTAAGYFDDRGLTFAPEHAKIVTAIACFYDLDDPNRFLQDVKQVLHPNGLLVIQMAYLNAMLRDTTFDNICHEHLTYFNLTSITRLIQSNGFNIFDLRFNPVNGGSFRIYCTLPKQRVTFSQDSMDLMGKTLGQEVRDTEDLLRRFRNTLPTWRGEVLELIRQVHNQGQEIWSLGASTKGSTLFQYLGLGHQQITAAAERDPHKVGKVTSGTRIPITSEDVFHEWQPAYALVQPWHFIDEITKREEGYLQKGGKLIVPLPKLRVLSA